MACFFVKTKEMQTIVKDLADSANKVGNYYESINQVRNSLMPTLAQSGNVRNRLERLASNCDGFRNKLNTMSGKMDEIIILYIAAENAIVDNAAIKSPEQQNSTGSSPFIPGLPPVEELLPGENLPKEDSEILDYFIRSLKQILLGNFTDDSTLLGIVGSVIVGCTPIGWIADLRDIAGDLYQFRDGVETEEVISLVVDVVALVPLCDLLKYSDECLGLTKYADEAGEALGGIIDYTRGVWKKADDVIAKVDDLVDKGGKFASDVINKTMDLYNNSPQFVQKQIAKTINTMSKEFGNSTVGAVIKDVTLEAIGVEDKLIEAAADAVDSIGNGITTGIENITQRFGEGWEKVWNTVTGEPEPEMV